MPTLIIHQGSHSLRLSPDSKKTYSYQIGAGKIVGRETESLNDADALNRLSLELRDRYVEWIYRFNKEFVQQGLTWEGTSLYFFSDLSSKRLELFDTYNTVCLLTLISRRAASVHIDEILLYGLDSSFVKALKSIFPRATIKVKKSRPTRVLQSRRVFADLKFLVELAIVRMINLIVHPIRESRDESKRRYFFSFYPQMFDNKGRDTRYGEGVGDEERYIVALMADGMHQRLSPIRYLKSLLAARKRGLAIVDLAMRAEDLWEGIRLWWHVCTFTRRRNGKADYFGGINLSGYIKEELVWSASRISRVIVFGRAFERTLSSIPVSNLTYIVFEYPLGRVISAVTKKCSSTIEREGFNHGETSFRFLNYFMAEGEASKNSETLSQCPIPDRVLAEDSVSAQVYRSAGYQNVGVMDTVHRAAFLNRVFVDRSLRRILLVPGLHDGEDFLCALLPEVHARSDEEFLFRPHPRGDNRYLRRIKRPKNLHIDGSPIEVSLSSVSSIFVSYSGLGLEAARLGLPVTVVNIPGRINWSRCIDHVSDQKVSGLPTNLEIRIFSP